MDYLCYCLVFVMLALWSPAGKGLTSWLLFVVFSCAFVSFSCGILAQVWYLYLIFYHVCVCACVCVKRYDGFTITL